MKQTPRSPIDRLFNRLHPNAWAALILAAGLFTTAALSTWVDQQQLIDNQRGLALFSQQHQLALQHRLDEYPEMLHGLQVQFYHKQALDRSDFARLVIDADLLKRHPGLAAVAFVRYVTALDKRNVDSGTGKQLNPANFPGLAIFPPGERGEYFVIDYLAPEQGSGWRAGFDIATRKDLGAAMRQARDTGEGVLSPPLTLPPQIAVSTLPVVELFAPVYRPDMKIDTHARRRAAFLGTIMLSIRPDEALNDLIPATAEQHFAVTIRDTDDQGKLIYDSRQRDILTDHADESESLTVQLAAFGRHWKINYLQLSLYPSAARWLMLASGATISILFAMLAWSLTRRLRAVTEQQDVYHKLVRQQVDDARTMHRMMNQTQEGWLTLDKRSIVTFANPAACRLLDKPIELLIGNPLYGLSALPECKEKSEEDAADALPTVVDTLRIEGASGRQIALEVSQWREFDFDGQALGSICRIGDNSVQQRQDVISQSMILQLRDILEFSSDWYWETDANLTFTRVSSSIAAKSAFIGANLLERLQHKRPDLSDRSPEEGAHRQLLDNRQPFKDFTYQVTTTDQRTRYISVSGKPMYSENGLFQGYRGIARDVTYQKIAEAALFAEKERAQVTLESIGDGVITTDTAGRIEYINPIACQLTGWSLHETVGRPLGFAFKIVDENTHDPLPDPIALALQSGHVVKHNGHTVLIRLDGHEFAIEETASPIRDRDDNLIGGVLVFRDVSQSRALAAQLSYQASHDELTGLANRRELEFRLNHLLQQGSPDAENALLYLDLDQFKVVNDTCGHIAGDQLLKQLSTLMQSQLRSVDTLARMGGDEFAVLLEKCPIAAAINVAEKIRTAVAGFHFAWDNKLFSVGTSIGLVAFQSQQYDLATLLSSADSACYLAKEKGRNRVQIHHPDDSEVTIRHGEMEWVARIHKALAQDRFQLYFQTIAPIGIDAGDQGLHVEILVRMVDETGNLVPPMAFIPAAERYNLMPAIDRWIVSHTFQFLAAHREQLPTIAACAINLSGGSIGDYSFLAFIREQFDIYGIAHQCVCFEVTETAAIANLAKASQFIREMKALGASFALDDFGAGMSSFAYLKHLPIDYLKIDGGFVKDMLNDPIDSAMVDAINKIGHVMGLKTIAEFVENDATIERLREIGVDFAQGYGVAKPMPLDALFPSDC